MDRFLAEIDRLRRKARPRPPTSSRSPPPPGRGRWPGRRRRACGRRTPAAAATPTATGSRSAGSTRSRTWSGTRTGRRSGRRPARRGGRRPPRPRGEPAPVKSRRIEAAGGALATPVAPGTLSPSRVEELPVAPVVTGPAASTGAAAHPGDADRRAARPVARTDFAKNLTALLGSGPGARRGRRARRDLRPARAAAAAGPFRRGASVCALWIPLRSRLRAFPAHAVSVCAGGSVPARGLALEALAKPQAFARVVPLPPAAPRPAART